MNSLMKTLSPSATTMIKMDHAAVLSKYHKVAPDDAPATLDAAVRNIVAALEVHAQVEEEIFYPALREAGISSPVLEKSVPEHDEMRQRISQLQQTQGQPAARLEALAALMNAVMHHVADEETVLLPLAEQRLSKQQLSELGQRMTERKMVLAKPRMNELVVDMVRAQPKRSAAMGAGALVVGAMLVRALISRRSPRWAR